MVNKSFAITILGLFSLGVVASASASLISDFDLNSFDFDVTNYSTSGIDSKGISDNATAAGTSNGIGWSILEATNIFNTFTIRDGSYSFDFLPQPTDTLHVSTNFTITFDSVIDKLLVAVDNNNASTDSINFGISPTDYSGVLVSGTQVSLAEGDTKGGLVLYENLNSLTISHTNNNGILDGFNIAFHAVRPSISIESFANDIGPNNHAAPVPEPATMLLFGTGLVGLAGARFRKKK